MRIDQKDLGAGAVFVAVATLYGAITRRDLPIGEPLAMGPGYFPMLLCGAIGFVGFVLIARSFVGKAPTGGLLDGIDVRVVVMVCAAIVFFGIALRPLGLFLAVAGTAFLCSMASRGFRPLRAAALAFGLASLATAIFGYGVRLPLPIVGEWFTG